MKDDEKAARERLGAWLAAEPGRGWDSGPYQVTGFSVGLYTSVGDSDVEPGPPWLAAGPTLAEAILKALDLAEGFARHERTR